MRSGTGTNSRPPAVVVRATKSRMALFAPPSFHDGSGSFCAKPARLTTTIPAAASPKPNERRSMPTPPLRQTPTVLSRACTVICADAWPTYHDGVMRRHAGRRSNLGASVRLAFGGEQDMRRRTLLAFSMAMVALDALRASAQNDKQPFKPEELDQMLAPVALYPDSLLSQVLMAAGYPLEIVEAARWSKANPTLKGDAAVAAVKDMSWDTSVKSLVAFPDVLGQMNEHLDWAQKMGDAMISQEQDVADSIQRLRAKAQAAGNLQSTPQQTVTTQGSGDNVQYVIAPTDPQVVYVPSYNPGWVYGSWPYPAYPPTYYPLAGALARGFFWGVGFAAGN